MLSNNYHDNYSYSCNSSTTTTVTLPSPPTHQHFNYSSMTRDQQKYCGAIVRNLKRHRDAAPFKNPVNHVEVPDYPLIIKHPMDLNHVETKLNNSDYPTVEEFIADVRLIFNNCFKYNGPEAIISVLCQNVESAFEKSLRQMPSSQAVKQEQQRQMSISKEPSPPLSQHNLSSPPPVLDDYLSGGRPKREIHCPSKDYPETFTTPIKKPSQNTSLQMKYCWQVLREFKKTKYRNQIYPFLTPVDPIELNLPDYTTIIKNPMDLSSIEHKLLNDQYKEPEQFEQDVVLVFNNCYTYNPPTSPIYQMAQEMSRVFQDKWAQRPLIADVVKKEEEGSGSVGLKKSSAGNSRRQSSTKSSTKRKSVSKSESDDVDLDEEDQEDPDDQIAQLERSIKNISKQIESMQQNTQKRKSATPPSIKQEVEPKPKKKLGRPVGRTDSVKRKRMGKKPVLDDSDDDEGVKDYPFSHDEKMALSREINTLDDERLLAVSSIIQRSMPQLQKNGEDAEIELDIDALDVHTLNEIYTFIHPYSRISQTKKNNSKRFKKSRTHYSEKQSEKMIHDLEQKLKRFDETEKGICNSVDTSPTSIAFPSQSTTTTTTTTTKTVTSSTVITHNGEGYESGSNSGSSGSSSGSEDDSDGSSDSDSD